MLTRRRHRVEKVVFNLELPVLQLLIINLVGMLEVDNVMKLLLNKPRRKKSEISVDALAGCGQSLQS